MLCFEQHYLCKDWTGPEPFVFPLSSALPGIVGCCFATWTLGGRFVHKQTYPRFLENYVHVQTVDTGPTLFSEGMRLEDAVQI